MHATMRAGQAWGNVAMSGGRASWGMTDVATSWLRQGEEANMAPAFRKELSWAFPRQWRIMGVVILRHMVEIEYDDT